MNSIWNNIRDAVEESKLNNGPKNVRISVPQNVDPNLKDDLTRGGYTVKECNYCGKIYWIITW